MSHPIPPPCGSAIPEMATVVERLRRKSAYLNRRYKGMDVADAEGILYNSQLNSSFT
jgi:hypothetical protein